MYSHVGQILEDERLVKLRVEVLPVDLGLVLGLLVGEQVDLHEGVGEPRGPVSGGQVAALNHLITNKFLTQSDNFERIVLVP